MKALTLHQPWATLLALGEKTIETRSWDTKHRGIVAIHAGKKVDRSAWKLPEFRRSLLERDDPITPENIQTGGVIALLGLVETVELPSPEGDRDVRYVPRLKSGVSVFRRLPTGRTKGVLTENNLAADRRDLAFGDFSAGRFAWIFGRGDVLPETIPCRGLQRLWDLPTIVETMVLQAIALNELRSKQ